MTFGLESGRLAILGGTGLIGRALLTKLAATGASRVVVLGAQPPEAVSGLRVDFYQGDVRNVLDVETALAGCTTVVHLAGMKHAGRSAVAPSAYFDVNAGGAVTVMEAAKRCGVTRVVFASTAHVYGPPKTPIITEDHPTHPLSIYAASKLAGEAAVVGYAESFGLSGVVARLANVYGGTPDFETVVGRAVLQVLAGEPVQLRNHKAVRDFIEVRDAAEGLLRLAALPASKGATVVNLSSGRGVSTGEIAELVASAAERTGYPRPMISPPEHPDATESVLALVLSAERLRALTGWVPSVSWAEGLGMMFRNGSTTRVGQRHG